MTTIRRLHVVAPVPTPAPPLPTDEAAPATPARIDTRGWPMTGPRPRRIDPAETLIRMQARSALTGIAFWDDTRSPPDDLSIDQARDVLRWFRPAT